jgi:hypothetical protein
MANPVLMHEFRRAIYLLVACQMNPAQVAEIMGKRERTIRRWMSNPQFRALLDKKQDQIDKFDAKKFRATNNRLISERVYAEIQKKMTEPDAFDDMTLSGLVRMARDLNFEHRIDDQQPLTPDDATDIVGLLMVKFAKAHQRNDIAAAVVNGPVIEQRPQLRLISPPAEVAAKRKEKANG